MRKCKQYRWELLKKTKLNSFYTLAARPELISMLRDDVHQALAESEGVFTHSALQSMEKLDSFLRETLRYYPMGACKHLFPCSPLGLSFFPLLMTDSYSVF